jgi:hypothetical protein
MSDDNGKLTAAELSNFTGSEHWYRHGIVRNVLLTRSSCCSKTSRPM